MLLDVNKFYVKFIGLILLGLFLYFRFIKERLPRSLYIFYEQNDQLFVNYGITLLITFSTILAVAIVKTSLSFLRNKPLKIPNYFFIKYLISFIQIIKESLFAVYKHIIESRENSYDEMRCFCSIVNHYIKGKELYIVYFEIFLLALCCTSFLFDVFIKFEVNYFYKSVMFATLILIIKLYWHLVLDLTNNISVFTENLIITPKILANGENDFDFEVKPGFDPETVAATLDYDASEYRALVALNVSLQAYNNFADYYKPRAMFIIYLCYLIGWVYVLYQNLII